MVIALLLAGSMWCFVQRVLIPHQKSVASEFGVPRGILSDLYPRWYGARELLLRHRDPYGPEVTAEIQSGYYGRSLDPVRAADPKDQQRFAYPVYVAFLLAPTVGMDFEHVEALAFWLFVLATVASAMWWLRLLRWDMRSSHMAVFIILLLGSFPAVQGLKLQQLTLLVSAMSACALLLIARGWLFTAGCLLALATIKPHLVALLLLWLFVWIAGNWRERQRLLWGFLATVALLLIASEFVLPGWTPEFWRGMVAYSGYAGGESLLVALTGSMVGGFLTIVAIAFSVLLGWRERRESATSDRWYLTTALVLVVTIVVVPSMATYNQVLLLPAVLLVLRYARELWANRSLGRLPAGLCIALLGWPWLVTALMTLTALVLGTGALMKFWWLPIYPQVLLPLSLLAMVPGLNTVVRSRVPR